MKPLLFSLFGLFIMRYVGGQDCGSEMNAFSYTKTFSSPNYPSNYENNLNCNWVISASPGHVIKLTFNPFFTESCCDYVQLYDGSTSIGQYRGHKNNLVITSKTGTLRVNLRSDDSINGLGFSASYKEEDLDECATASHNCNENAVCHNADGSYTCSCKRGFNGNGTTCLEINECNDAIHPPNCHVDAHCIDQIDGYLCQCNEGYAGDGIQCDDLDECKLEQARCHNHATCNNRDGSFICKCNEGYEGDGFICKDLDECSLQKHECSFDSACRNSPGGYFCVCPTGYTGNGYQCTDVDECTQSPMICGRNARCVNRVGDYNCVCADGYAGDGKVCHKAFEVLCLPGSISVRVIKRYYTDKKIMLQDLHLSDFTCKGKIDPDNQNIWVFNLTTLSSCSTIHMNNATHLMYSNTISNVLDDTHVYVGSALINSFSCTYKRMLDDLDLFSFNYGVYQNVANLTAGSNLGVFIAKMNHFTDSTYSKLDTNQDYKTSDKIFVKIELETSDPSLNLVLESCWITPSPNIRQRKFNFIEQGNRFVPLTNNSKNSLTKRCHAAAVTQSGKGPVALFHSQIFAFVDYNTTFLHCSLLICPSTPGKSCEPKCVSGINSNKYSSIGDDTVSVGVLTSHLRKKRASKKLNEEEILSMGPFRRKKKVLPKIVVKFLELSVTGIFKTKNFNFFLNEYNFKDISEAPSSSVLIKESSVFDLPLFPFFLATVLILLIICFVLVGFLIGQRKSSHKASVVK